MAAVLVQPQSEASKERSRKTVPGEVTIESSLNDSHDFRVSSVRDPLPLPLHLEPLTNQSLAALREKYASIVQANEINALMVGFKCASKPGYPKGDRRPILAVLVDPSSESTTTWTKAKDELRRSLNSHGLDTFGVEIWCREKAFMPALNPIKPEHPTIAIYEGKWEALLDILKERLSGAWTAMSLFELVSISNKPAMALVVFVEPYTVKNWKDVEYNLNTVINEPRIHVKTLPGGTLNLTGKSLRKDLKMYKVPLKPCLGSSIGEVGQSGADTLGGHVNLNINGSILTGFLTNHHVVRPFAAATNQLHPLNRLGYGSHPYNIVTKFQYPAQDDFNATVAEMEKVTLQAEQMIIYMKQVLERFEMKGEPAP